MTTWSLVGSSLATPAGSVNQFAIPAISAVEAGDVLVAFIGASSTWSAIFPSPTWNARAGGVNWANDQTFNLYDRIATSAEPSSYLFTLNSGVLQEAEFIGLIVALRQTGGLAQWDSSQGQMNLNSVITSPSIVLQGNPDAVVWAALQTTNVPTVPTGWTTVESATNQSLTLAAGWTTLSSGPTGNVAGGNPDPSNIVVISGWLSSLGPPPDTLESRRFSVAPDPRTFFVGPSDV